MRISRRGVLQLVAGGLAGLSSGFVIAQAPQRTFEESFRSITPQPAVAGNDKIEVIDFFWYGCP